MLEELKALIKSPKLWVTMIGVALVPALYNLSFWGLCGTRTEMLMICQ